LELECGRKSHGTERATGRPSLPHLLLTILLTQPQSYYSILSLFTFLFQLLYLDHAGATLPDHMQLHDYYQFLMTSTLANPHSRGPLGENLNQIIDSTRQEILNHFGADSREYSVIYTSGATAAIKLIGECFPWSHSQHEESEEGSASSIFLYSSNSHTSILGLRQYAPTVSCLPSQSIWNLLQQEDRGEDKSESHSESYSLLALPGECNFSGTKYPPVLIAQLLDYLNHEGLDFQFQSLKAHPVKVSSTTTRPSSSSLPPPSSHHQTWLWLLDASKLASTNSINLTSDFSSQHRPHFVCCSFYKIFGFPTGIGALLVKKTVLPLLKKRFIKLLL
jgi:molybdenum cofactor sulfurtransferase